MRPRPRPRNDYLTQRMLIKLVDACGGRLHVGAYDKMEKRGYNLHEIDAAYKRLSNLLNNHTIMFIDHEYVLTVQFQPNNTVRCALLLPHDVTTG